MIILCHLYSYLGRQSFGKGSLAENVLGLKKKKKKKKKNFSKYHHIFNKFNLKINLVRGEKKDTGSINKLDHDNMESQKFCNIFVI